jgi:hypothetical protein
MNAHMSKRNGTEIRAAQVHFGSEIGRGVVRSPARVGGGLVGVDVGDAALQPDRSQGNRTRCATSECPEAGHRGCTPLTLAPAGAIGNDHQGKSTQELGTDLDAQGIDREQRVRPILATGPGACGPQSVAFKGRRWTSSEGWSMDKGRTIGQNSTVSSVDRRCQSGLPVGSREAIHRAKTVHLRGPRRRCAPARIGRASVLR